MASLFYSAVQTDALVVYPPSVSAIEPAVDNRQEKNKHRKQPWHSVIHHQASSFESSGQTVSRTSQTGRRAANCSSRYVPGDWRLTKYISNRRDQADT